MTRLGMLAAWLLLTSATAALIVWGLHVPLASSRAAAPPLPVGQLFVPDACTPQPATSPIVAPPGHAIAQLATVPAAFDVGVSVVFPPCDTPSRPPAAAPQSDVAGISYSIESEVQYTGAGGTLVISVSRPSAAALSYDLQLGSPDGSRPDGNGMFSAENATGASQVRWMQNGLIISVEAPVSVAGLTAVAKGVAVTP